MRFKRPIRPFQAYEIRTRVSGMDNKWIFLEHRFFVKERCVAAGICKVVVLDDKGKSIDPHTLFEDGDQAPMSEAGRLMLAMEPHFGRDN